MKRALVAVMPFVGILALPAGASADDPSTLRVDLRPAGIYGGTDVASCGWPTTVSVEGSCTGTLVHPQVVIYAQHCGSGYNQIRLGENVQSGPGKYVQTNSCMTYPGGGPGTGLDFAFCTLAEAVTDVPLVPILMGCETDILQPGQNVTIVGFGNSDTGPYGVKREVTTTVNSIDGNNEISIGGNGKDSCQGDSGGPVFVQVSDGTWRVFGITSYGGACGSGGVYSMMHIGMEWFESQSGFDLTPCTDAAGTWMPGPDCKQFPTSPMTGGGSWAAGCDAGPLASYSATCGAPFGAMPDMTPPTVTITAPVDGTLIDSMGVGSAMVGIMVDAADGDGWGVQDVQLVIDGAAQDPKDVTAPYGFPATFPAGLYTLTAIATDYAGNQATSAPVTFGIDEMPPTTTGGDASGTGTDGSGTVGSDSGTSADTSGTTASSASGSGGTASGSGSSGTGSSASDTGASGSGGETGGNRGGGGCRVAAGDPEGSGLATLALLGLFGVGARRRPG